MVGRRWLASWLWLLTTPFVIFRGWQISAVAANSMLDRLAVAVAMALLPVGTVLALRLAWRRETLKNHVVLPWWCLALFAVLVFPVLFCYLAFDFERTRGHGVSAALWLVAAWAVPHVLALTLLAVSTASDFDAEPPEPPAPQVAEPPIAATGSDVLAASVPTDVPHYRPGAAPGNMRTSWQLSQEGLTPGSPPCGWLLLNNGPGMYLYDIHRARRR